MPPSTSEKSCGDHVEADPPSRSWPEVRADSRLSCMSLGAELGSLSSTIDGLVQRIGELARSTEGHATDDVSVALYDVERSLAAASRRLGRVLRDLQRK